ncbi:phosphatase PAP2 family protein [Umboniibacter marinipuniceus]|uniref:undecaprenyl-diphosphate phosphatase n=1 Tax=Umboniibacter marinipuniceus TaxID=569599 RepID=A0A3M0A5D7_9GAMM|nr:phosphatase PAP2 family protein [Umboniibacter marinipuniceus]RMA77675.1 PAP2 superfamily protein [Umboniibacter marinipuniceus]
MRRILLALSLSLSLSAVPSYANDDVADFLQLALPATAAGITVITDDYEGLEQFAYALGSTVATTYALKSLVSSERPNGEDEDSFPSGHASVTFSAASFIDRRYGHQWGIPAYVLASYTAYSRYENDHHKAEDVLVGALIGYGFSHLFVDEYSDVQIGAVVSERYSGLSVSYAF